VSLALYPAFSSLAVSDRRRLERLYAASLKVLALVGCPLAMLLVVLAPELLSVWLGPQFAEEGAGVLQVLAVGWLFSTIGFVPSTALQACGYPHVVAGLLLLGALGGFPLLLILSRNLGILGTAVAVASREMLGVVLFPAVASKVLRLNGSPTFVREGLRTAGALVGVATGLGVAALLSEARAPVALLKCALAGGVIVIYAWGVWRYVLTQEERAVLRAAMAFMR
jgi:O-antigen/teichoic acid export membrane protein